MTRLNAYMQRLQRRIESAAKDSGTAPLFSLETMLLVLSVVYASVMRLRVHLYESGMLPSKRLPCRVVSIGNIIAGGTGKTPMTVFVAQILKDQGCSVAVISRGYRGRMEKRGGIVSDGQTILVGPEEAGDEPYLMAKVLKGIPVIVGRQRFESGMLAVKRFNPDVIVLDDAFQHLRLKRDLDLVLLDGRSPFGNGHVLPRGMLREPIRALHRADAIVFTRSPGAIATAILDALPAQRPVFCTTHIPVIRNLDPPAHDTLSTIEKDISLLKGKKVVAFAGLANNDQFFDWLTQAGCILEDNLSFPDHHRYEPDELVRIARTAKEKGADLLVTTFKDSVKIGKGDQWPVGLMAVDVIIQLVSDENRFRLTLSNGLFPNARFQPDPK